MQKLVPVSVKELREAAGRLPTELVTATERELRVAADGYDNHPDATRVRLATRLVKRIRELNGTHRDE